MSKPQPVPPENPPVESFVRADCPGCIDYIGCCSHRMVCTGYKLSKAENPPEESAEATARESDGKPSSTVAQGVRNALQATNDIVSRCGVLLTNLVMVDRALDKEGKSDDDNKPENPPVESAEATARETDGQERFPPRKLADKSEPCGALNLGMTDPCNFEDGYCIRCRREEPEEVKTDDDN